MKLVSKSVTKDVSNTVEHDKTALKKNVFGTLTDIDLKEKFKETLDIEYSEYRILGSCNPGFANRVLDKNKSIAPFLPL